MRQRGFTVLEVVIAGTLLLALMAASITAVIADARAEHVLTAQLGPEMTVRHALDRMISELRMAGVRGEDRNDNGELDEGEDVNGNGRLDADWSLAEGAVDQPELIFNRRMDLVDEAGGLAASGVYSSPITYRQEGADLLRLWTRTDVDTGDVTVIRQTLVHGVRQVAFSRTGGIVQVRIEYQLPKGVYKTDFRALSASVRLRN